MTCRMQMALYSYQDVGCEVAIHEVTDEDTEELILVDASEQTNDTTQL